MSKRIALLLAFMTLLSAADELSACLGVNNPCNKNSDCCSETYHIYNKPQILQCINRGNGGICTLVDVK